MQRNQNSTEGSYFNNQAASEFDIQNCHTDLPGPIVRKNLQNYPTYALPRHYCQARDKFSYGLQEVPYKYDANETIDIYRKSG